jgi:hypothetical protein
MAMGNWIAAAELKEVRVIRQDELAQLLLGRRIERRSKTPTSSEIELDRTGQGTGVPATTKPEADQSGHWKRVSTKPLKHVER